MIANTRADQNGNGRPALLTYKGAGDVLGVSDRTVYQLVRDGELRAVRFGRSVRIDPRDLESFIARAKHFRDSE